MLKRTSIIVIAMVVLFAFVLTTVSSAGEKTPNSAGSVSASVYNVLDDGTRSSIFWGYAELSRLDGSQKQTTWYTLQIGNSLSNGTEIVKNFIFPSVIPGKYRLVVKVDRYQCPGLIYTHVVILELHEKIIKVKPRKENHVVFELQRSCGIQLTPVFELPHRIL